MTEIEQEINKKPIEQEIKKYFDRMQFQISANGFVDVTGNCVARQKEWLSGKFPVKFIRVGNHLICNGVGIHSLEGSPRIIGGDFLINKNYLSTLEGGPEVVNGIYMCAYNKLTSLVGLPKKLGLGLECYANPLKSLDGLPEKWNGEISLDWTATLPMLRLLNCNKINFMNRFDFQSVYSVQKIMNKYVGNASRANILQCQKELVQAGFEGNASW